MSANPALCLHVDPVFYGHLVWPFGCFTEGAPPSQEALQKMLSGQLI